MFFSYELYLKGYKYVLFDEDGNRFQAKDMGNRDKKLSDGRVIKRHALQLWDCLRVKKSDVEDLKGRYIVANNLKEIRLKLGLTQSEMAKKLGITQSHVCQIESQKTEMSARVLVALRASLGIDLNELVDEQSQKVIH